MTVGARTGESWLPLAIPIFNPMVTGVCRGAVITNQPEEIA